MEYILENIDIFDEGIDQELKLFTIDIKGIFAKIKLYIFKVSFHVNLLNGLRF